MEIVLGYVFMVAAFVLGFILGYDRTAQSNSDLYFVLLVVFVVVASIFLDPILGFVGWQLFTFMEALLLVVGYTVGVVVGS